MTSETRKYQFFVICNFGLRQGKSIVSAGKGQLFRQSRNLLDIKIRSWWFGNQLYAIALKRMVADKSGVYGSKMIGYWQPMRKEHGHTLFIAK